MPSSAASADSPPTLPASSSPSQRFEVTAITAFAQDLLERAGLSSERAFAMADVLVEGDLLGHDTHGLQLLPEYLSEIGLGGLTTHGEPTLLSSRGAVQAWDGKRLPGPWLTLKAIEAATAMARQYGTGTVSIGHCHHIACLAVYARRVAEQGLVLTLYSASPSASSVAPYGGTRPVFSPSPLAIGFPTSNDPVLVDVSTSTTSNGMVDLARREGRKLPGNWLIDETGTPTDDPLVRTPPRAGTILPLGGVDSGHKGFGLALMVEALTAGLAGHGRADPPERKLGATVLVQVLDPSAFNGLDAFNRQMDWVADACHRNPPIQGGEPVRLPGERGLGRRRAQMRDGVLLSAGVVDGLRTWAKKLNAPDLPPSSHS